MWQALLCVFLGSGVGGALRYLTGVGLQALFGDGVRWMLPWSTFLVNVAGCFLFGLFFGLSLNYPMSKEIRLMLTTGFCGGLTTFSTFSYEILDLMGNGQYLTAAGYALISLLLGIGAAALGLCLAR